ncbi:MAG: MBOAT family protein [Clostridia bacterium]|nr:MBOAT family protein [Clostridia bacterium]
MALNSFSFLIWFCGLFLVLLVIELLKKRIHSPLIQQSQPVVLLIFSYLTLFAVDWRFLLCVLLITAWTFAFGFFLGNAAATVRKRLLLAAGITGILLSLGYFKYTNFFLTEVAALLGTTAQRIEIILPIGISFYSFSAISYLMDVYRKKYPPVTNALHFALYIAFFPKFMSGPIVRGDVFFPQVKNYRGVTFKTATEGVQIFVFGLFKKIVLADHLSVFVDDVFAAPSVFNTATVILAVISYSLQIYFDFSGYSDMAIGISKMIGFDFPANFNLPYIANGFSDFWKRWHISLSSWFQEYLYYPLGGSRKGRLRTYINLLIVMLVSGLWHGAGTTFLLWGLLHGVFSCAEHLLRQKKRSYNPLSISNLIRIIAVYAIVALLWVPFRADTVGGALAIWKCCFVPQSGVFQPYFWTFIAVFCLIVSTIYAVVKWKKECAGVAEGRPPINGSYPLLDLTSFVPLCLFFVFCGLTIILGYFGNTAFIYGKF